MLTGKFYLYIYEAKHLTPQTKWPPEKSTVKMTGLILPSLVFCVYIYFQILYYPDLATCHTHFSFTLCTYK